MSEIDKAVQILRAGGLVAFPTETVYGLGADATNASAINRIFEAKGRPSTNPLIVHVADIATAKKFAANWPQSAQSLAEKFWPGPLTLVLLKSPAIVDAVTAGRNTVGLRVPNHPLALELLKAFNGPLAAPSANRSTRVSPTTADHVKKGLSVDFVLDGGPCAVGIESTVLDLSQKTPRILRPGAITREQIEAIIGKVSTSTIVSEPTPPASSPGQQEIHYAPKAFAYRFEPAEFSQVLSWCNHNPGLRGILNINQHEQAHRALSVQMPPAPADYARSLYSMLRELDEKQMRVIFIEMPPDAPEWLAIRDRLVRASRPLRALPR